jgi:hypothetical protein
VNYYVIIFEYSSASVIVETINFKSLNQKNRFDFDSFVNEKYGSSTSYMCSENVTLKANNLHHNMLKKQWFYE